MDYKSKGSEFRQLIDSASSISIVSHIRPDGDTISSALALYNLLKKEGKRVEVCCLDGDLPRNFSFLSGFDKYKNQIDFSDSLVITVDCAELARAGFDLHSRDIVNIDHHVSNSNFGSLNIVSTEVATATVVFNLIKDEFKLDNTVAVCLYAGLLSDSRFFSTSLTSKSSFFIALELLEYGINPSDVANKIKNSKSLSSIRLLTYALESLELYNDARVSVMILREDDFKRSGATASDIIGIIDYGLSLATVEVAVIIVEFSNFLKVSLRSINEDVSQIAKLFGGGGHINASAFEVKNVKITEIKKNLLTLLKDN